MIPRLFIAVLLLVVAGCTRPPTETQLRAQLDEMQAAVEAREPGRFLADISDDFQGQPPAADKEELGRYLRALLLSLGHVGVTRPSTVVQLDGPWADVETRFLVTGGQGRLPTEGQWVEARTRWRFDGTRWSMVSASWSEG